MFILKSNQIKQFPFHEARNLSEGPLEEWALSRSLLSHNLWMLPQILAHYGNYTVTKLDNGLYCPTTLVRSNLGSDDWEIGLWKVINKLKRSSLVKSQIAPQFSEYSALVPIILAGLKKYQGIKYSEWSAEGLQHVIEPKLYEAATFTDYPNLSNDELMYIRTQGLTTKSGPSAGTVKKATSSWCLTGIKQTTLGSVPQLTGTMLTQIWVAHPSVRHPNMILNPKDWDNMPSPLISTEIFKSSDKDLGANDVPWL